LHARLAPALAGGGLRLARGGIGLVPRDGLPAGFASVLGRAAGRCVFHGDGAAACRLHSWGGADAKPIACRQFPWLAVHDPRGTFVSLSHVCPTAGALLRDPAGLVVGTLPLDARAFDGLDVRRALPPALDARRLADWDAVSAWEQQALDACARGPGPQDVVHALADLLAHARRWHAAAGPLGAWIAAWPPGPRPGGPWQPDPALDVIMRAAVPAPLAAPPPIAPVPLDAWTAGTAVLRRYLAARLVACWPLHYGQGLGTMVAYAEALLAVLATELARPRRAGSTDDAHVIAAISETDRLAVHLAAPDALARGLDGWRAAATGSL
jgi:hypothetical protein